MIALAPLAPVAGKLALAAGKGALSKAATRALVSGAGWQAGAEIVAQIADWARSIDGDWDSEGITPSDGIGPENGCWKMESGAAIYEENSQGDPNSFNPPTGAQCNVLECTASVVETFPDSDAISVELTRRYSDGTTNTSRIGRWTGWKWRLNPACGNGVCSDEPYPDTPGEPNPPLALPPIQSGDCTINTTFYGFMGRDDGQGSLEPVFVMEPAADLRAGGGIIVGECNFQPTVVVGGGGDGNEPPKTYPMPPDPPGSDGWWESIAKGAAAGVAAYAVGQALGALFGEQQATSYTLVAPCDKDEEGNPATYTVELPKSSFNTRLMAWQVAQADLLQQHLNWRTPTCRGSNELEGQWVTTRWISDEKMVDSSRRLRKLFRYRTKSTRDLGQLSAYWEQFVWRAGPVCVRHTGAWWGDPQVWAESPEEGERVIRHAASEAGIDPDKTGEWAVSSSRSPRYGMSGTMRILEKEGFPWVSSRDGANWPNLLAKKRNP
jgi:hypothetical protein